MACRIVYFLKCASVAVKSVTKLTYYDHGRACKLKKYESLVQYHTAHLEKRDERYQEKNQTDKSKVK